MFATGQRIKVKYGVMYKGWDLTDEIGVIKDDSSYLKVYIPSLDMTCDLFRHEVELYKKPIIEEDEDIRKIFY